MSLFLAFLLFICGIPGIHGNVNDQLYRDIFADYVSAVRPSCDVNNYVTRVNISLALRQIIELDEPKQLINTIVWVRLQWYDCRLQWNASEYGNISNIVLPQEGVWMPDITRYDYGGEQNKLPGVDDYNIQLSSDGYIKYNFPSIVKSLCAVDVTHFPFDYQACKLTFGSWAFAGSQVDIYNTADIGDMTSYVENAEWYVNSIPAARHVTAYGTELYPTITFLLRLERRPLFYGLNLLFPCFLITSVAVLSFLLPPESGEKVNLEITVMLSLAVFQLIVMDLMPATGDTLPFIGLYFITSMVLVGLSCLATVIVLNVHFRGNSDTPLPYWIKRFVYVPLMKLTCTTPTRKSEGKENLPKLSEKEKATRGFEESIFKTTMSVSRNASLTQNPIFVQNNMVKNTNNENMDILSPTVVEDKENKKGAMTSILEKINASLSAIEDYVKDSTAETDDGAEWRTLAVMLDRLFMVVYLSSLLTCATALTVRYIVFTEVPDIWNNF